MTQAERFADELMGRFAAHRGPGPGGGTGPGQAWHGIVEDTPALWVTWIVDGARRAGRDPLALRLTVGNTPLRMAWVQLRFGRRYYWECPHCGRRCEAVYVARYGVGCRACLRLGYRSQTHRAASPYAVFDDLFERRLTEGRYGDPGGKLDGMLDDLHKHLQGKIDSLLAKVTITAAPEAPQGGGPGELAQQDETGSANS